MPRLEHRTAIITGAASGIGRATALLFAAEGARVALVDTNAAGLDETAAAIAAGGGSSHTLVQDVTDGAAAMRAAAELKQTWGTLDALVTSAAVSVDGNVGTVSEEDWDRVFAVNVKGTFLWCKAVLPHMVQARRGSIVTIASQLAFCGGRDNAAYVTSKNAVLGLTRALALDYADQGVRANVLVPGAIETPRLERFVNRFADPAAARERSRLRHPLGRFGTAEEVARAALFLASDESSFTTGAPLILDGGWLVG